MKYDGHVEMLRAEYPGSAKFGRNLMSFQRGQKLKQEFLQLF